jgi:hypothetical protein
VTLGITNTGRISIRYNKFDFSGDTALQTESGGRWKTEILNAFAIMPSLLEPGSSTHATIFLRRNTQRWRVVYGVQAASVRERVLYGLPRSWRRSAYPFCKRYLSDKAGEEVQFVSQVFEVPYVLEHDKVPEPPLQFDPFTYSTANFGATDEHAPSVE